MTPASHTISAALGYALLAGLAAVLALAAIRLARG